MKEKKKLATNMSRETSNGIAALLLLIHCFVVLQVFVQECLVLVSYLLIFKFKSKSFTYYIALLCFEGGGIVKGPLMLQMGVHPAVASASSATMILFTSVTATTSFVVFGLLDFQYAPICFVIGFLSTLVGQLGLAYLMKKANRNSYIAFSIGLVVLLSVILMTIQSLLSLAEGEKHKSGGICGRDT